MLKHPKIWNPKVTSIERIKYRIKVIAIRVIKFRLDYSFAVYEFDNC